MLAREKGFFAQRVLWWWLARCTKGFYALQKSKNILRVSSLQEIKRQYIHEDQRESRDTKVQNANEGRR